MFASPDPRLHLASENGIATLAIDNRDRRNAFDLAMWRALPTLLEAVAASDARVLVLRGKDDLPFASGADISEFATVRADAKGGRAYEASNEDAFAALAALPIPTIAAIRRWCLGGGVGLALACDIRIASDDAMFGIPAARLGLGYPPAAMPMVVAAIGASAAKELFFTARQVDAQEALRMRLVQRVVAREALDDEVTTMAQGIAANAPLSLRAAKAAINAAAGLPATEGGDMRALADACFDSADYAEGREAFLAKRPPVFRGR